jgi:hypothetical protein
LAALLGLASAKKSIKVPSNRGPVHNSTHFIDQATKRAIVHFDCDVSAKNVSKHFKHTISHLHSKHMTAAHGARAPSALVRKQVPTPINVNAYLHVITTVAKDGMYTQQNVDDPITAMNAAYNPIGVTFTLVNTTFTANDAWAVADGTHRDNLKTALRAGTYADLNLYLHSDLSGGILGTCTLPSRVPAGSDPSIYSSSGFNTSAGTMPGGDMDGYNAGGTGIHETGQWLGLLYTFKGNSCEDPGDSIADTLAQSIATSGCPTDPVQDSCPDQPGVDGIHNYMDYSTDACYSEFSPLQVARIGALWTQYRLGMYMYWVHGL